MKICQSHSLYNLTSLVQEESLFHQDENWKKIYYQASANEQSLDLLTSNHQELFLRGSSIIRIEYRFIVIIILINFCYKFTLTMNVNNLILLNIDILLLL